MAFVVAVLTFLLIRCTATGYSTPDYVNLDFHRAVLNAYDANRTFSENFNTILDALCPASVYCETAEDSEVGSSGTTSISNTSLVPESIDEALIYLRNQSSGLKGCCTRCSCENDCIEKSNCCANRNVTLLTDDVITKPEIKQECMAASLRSYIPGTELSKVDSMGIGYYMVTDCFDETVDKNAANKCRYPNASSPVEATPVFSFDTGRNYKNRFCAECNGDFNVTLWHPRIIFNDQISLTMAGALPTSPQVLYRRLMFGRKTRLVYEPPRAAQTSISNHRCLVPALELYRIGSDSCSNFTSFTEAQNSFFKQACAFRNAWFETMRLTYDNVFCLLCIDDMIGIMNNYRSDNCNGMQRFFPYTFSAVLKFVETNSRTLQEPDDDGNDNSCNCTEYHDTVQGICRQLVCPPGEHFVNCQCQPFLIHVTGMTIMVYLDIVPSEARHADKLGNLIGNGSKRRTRNFMSQTVKVLNSTWGPLLPTGWILYRETSDSDEHYLNFYTVLVMRMDHQTDNRRIIRRMFHGLHNGLTTTVFNALMRISLGRILKLEKKSLVYSGVARFDDRDGSDLKRDLLISEGIGPMEWLPIDPNRQPLSKTVFCRRVKLDTSEVEMLHNHSLSGLSPTYLGYVYSESDNSMCLDDFESLFIQHGSSENYPCCMYVFVAAFVSWAITPIP